MSLTLIRGLPGAGKSTLARQLVKQGFLHVEADMFFEGEGGYRYDPSKIKEAHQWCLAQTRAALAAGHRVVVSNTFVKKWEMAAYLEMCPKAEIIEAKGRFQNVHGVPQDVIERMAKAWETL